MVYSLEGLWKADIGDGNLYDINLPGTLDESNIGYKDSMQNQLHPDASWNSRDRKEKNEKISTRFTRKHTYIGKVRIFRYFSLKEWAVYNQIPIEELQKKRLFLEVERARALSLYIDGKEIQPFADASLSTPYIFEVTNFLSSEHIITWISDNSYPNMPSKDITYSSAATDETQTNWNGLLGYVRLRAEEDIWISEIRVYPKQNAITVKINVDAKDNWVGNIKINSSILGEQQYSEEIWEKEISLSKGNTEIIWENISLKKDVKYWDIEDGNLYELTASLSNGVEKSVTFGVRVFGDDGSGRLAINGRRFFLRGETNCAVFPETGYSPMDVDSWLDILSKYRAYGVNCMRFHSHCPPEAAFIAADQLGMLMQPELSHWNPHTALETDESYRYYKKEMMCILKQLANHPSFVMFTWGNELHASDLGHRRLHEFLQIAREIDNTRLYAIGSNVHYGELGCDADSDFYTADKYYKKDLRAIHSNRKGYINVEYPSTMHTYDAALEIIRKEYYKPVFGFEVGQYEVLPDFKQLENFYGISEPENLRVIKERVLEQGLWEEWERYVEATGELSCIGYREEIEAAMRTKELSGLSLLGLQDFPGQGTALVGMMDSHLKSKPYPFAEPKKFRAFFQEQLPLVLMSKYTWENTEIFYARIQIANYGKQTISGTVNWKIEGRVGQNKVHIQGEHPHVHCPVGELTDIGQMKVSLLEIKQAMRLNVTVTIGEIKNTYPLWVYPSDIPVCPKNIYETTYIDQKAKDILESGGCVYLTPPSVKEALPNSIQGQFTTDFWSVGCFPKQEGGMGMLIDHMHPLFKNFPTEFHSNWQWWPMASQRAVILPRKYQSIVTEMDSYAFLRPMTRLLECKCGNGKLLFSTMGLQQLQMYPEARALLLAIYNYMDSSAFLPQQEIPIEVFEALVKPNES